MAPEVPVPQLQHPEIAGQSPGNRILQVHADCSAVSVCRQPIKEAQQCLLRYVRAEELFQQHMNRIDGFLREGRVSADSVPFDYLTGGQHRLRMRRNDVRRIACLQLPYAGHGASGLQNQCELSLFAAANRKTAICDKSHIRHRLVPAEPGRILHSALFIAAGQLLHLDMLQQSLLLQISKDIINRHQRSLVVLDTAPQNPASLLRHLKRRRRPAFSRRNHIQMVPDAQNVLRRRGSDTHLAAISGQVATH